MRISRVDEWVCGKTGAVNSDTLVEYQIKRVNDTVEYTKRNCAFYAERLKGVKNAVSDIAELPFTLPEDIEKYSAEMLCVHQGRVSRIVTHMTSGTMSVSKRIFFSENDQNATIDFFHYGMKEFTDENDTVLILFPGKKEGSIGRLLASGLERMGAKPLIYGIVSDFSHLIAYISGKEINVIVGLPQQLLEFSRYCVIKGVSVLGLHSVLLSADYVAQSVVRAVEENLNCIVYEHYGMTEMCFGGGVYSKERDGYHLRNNDFLFEIVEPVTGEVLPCGEYGEVVFTSLNTEAMPLIRYRTGDIAKFVPHAEKFPVIEKIKGRVNGGIMLPNGKILQITELEEAIFVNNDLLDFSAVYSGSTLEIYVRSLMFDAKGIIEALQKSPVSPVLSGITVKVIKMDYGGVSGNTMAKRRIIVL